MYSLSTGEEKPVVTNTAPQKTPAISDGRVVWADGRIKGTSIFIYDIATGKEKAVSTASEYESNPAIDGNKIVWQDKRKGTMDIFVFTDESSDEIAANEKENSEGVKSPLGICSTAAAIAAAYLTVTTVKSKRLKK
jgi:beta propeller repeat protein